MSLELCAAGEHPDHVVVIKYVPYVADSKRAMDEYSAEIFMGGKQTIVMHNTCEDSLLAAPIILDLVILAGKKFEHCKAHLLVGIIFAPVMLLKTLQSSVHAFMPTLRG